MSGNQLDKVNPAPQEVSSSPDPLNPVVAGPKRGRPRLNRTPEEKREMRRVYMQKYRKYREPKGKGL